MTKRERRKVLLRHVRQYPSQAQAAVPLGITKQGLNRILHGRVRDVSPTVLARLMQIAATDTTTAA